MLAPPLLWWGVSGGFPAATVGGTLGAMAIAGLARLSPRSAVAVLTLMAFAVLTVLVLHHGGLA